MCAALSEEVPGHCQEQLTQTLIAFCRKHNCFRSAESRKWGPPPQWPPEYISAVICMCVNQAIWELKIWLIKILDINPFEFHTKSYSRQKWYDGQKSLPCHWCQWRSNPCPWPSWLPSASGKESRPPGGRNRKLKPRVKSVWRFWLGSWATATCHLMTHCL